MPVRGEWVTYGNQTGFLAWPEQARAPLPSVVVIQEVWGVDAHIEDVTRRVAASGYVALAPDLFAEGGKRPAALGADRIARVQAFGAAHPPGSLFQEEPRKAALAQLDPDDAARIVETLQAAFGTVGRLPSLVAPLRASVQYLRHERAESKDQRTGCVGFCMGGGLSALLSCEEPEVSAAAVFYGNAPAPEAVARSTCPVIGFYGGNDERVNVGIPGFEAAMKSASRPFETHLYPGVNHAFFNETGWAYQADAARDSWVRLLEFFRHHLVT
jgi:carboxymethylenebutenolidase